MAPGPFPVPTTTAGRIGSAEQFSALMSMVSAVQPGFDRLVQGLAESGRRALPPAAGVGIAVLEDGRLTHLSQTDDFVAQVDDEQYTAMRGPCVTAASRREVVLAPSLPDEDRWPDLTGPFGAAGVCGVLSVPLIAADRLVGTLNVYATRVGALGAATAALGREFAGPAAAALQRALVLRNARRATSCLGHGVTARRVVDRTVGLLIAQDGLAADEARTHLTQLARSRDQDPSLVAQEVWDQRAVGASAAPPPGAPATGGMERGHGVGPHRLLGGVTTAGRQPGRPEQTVQDREPMPEQADAMAAALSDGAAEVAAALDLPSTTTAELADVLRILVRDAGLAVPALTGLSLVRGGAVLTGLRDDAGPAVASLRVPLLDDLGGTDDLDQPWVCVLYADQRGAFAALADSLQEATGEPAEQLLDQDLGLPPASDVTALRHAAVRHMAEGVLIGRGFSTAGATTFLGTLAATSDGDTTAAARQVLESVS